MSIVSELKEFLLRGNVVDMAVGIVIGAAFGKIVGAMVDGILTPPIGWMLSGVDFSHIGIPLKEAGKDAAGNDTPAVKLLIGRLIQALIDFAIVGVCLFFVIKGMNRLKGKPEEKPKEMPEDVKLLTEIRDLLKNTAK